MSVIRMNAKYNIGIYKYCIGIYNVSYHYISMNVLYIMLVINT